MAFYTLAPDTRWSGLGAALGQGLTQGLMMKLQQQIQQQNMDKRAANIEAQREKDFERAKNQREDERDWNIDYKKGLSDKYYGSYLQVPTAEGQPRIWQPGTLEESGLIDKTMGNQLGAQMMTGVSMPKASPKKGWTGESLYTLNQDTGEVRPLPQNMQKQGTLSKLGKLIQEQKRYTKGSPEYQRYQRGINKLTAKQEKDTIKLSNYLFKRAAASYNGKYDDLTGMISGIDEDKKPLMSETLTLAKEYSKTMSPEAAYQKAYDEVNNKPKTWETYYHVK